MLTVGPMPWCCAPELLHMHRQADTDTAETQGTDTFNQNPTHKNFQGLPWAEAELARGELVPVVEPLHAFALQDVFTDDCHQRDVELEDFAAQPRDLQEALFRILRSQRGSRRGGRSATNRARRGTQMHPGTPQIKHSVTTSNRCCMIGKSLSMRKVFYKAPAAARLSHAML